MAEGGLRPPGNFINNAGNPSETSRNWNQWLEQFNLYMLATEKSTKDGEIQVAILLTLLGQQGQGIFRTFNLSDEGRDDIDVVKEAFTSHFAPQVKTVYERYKFHSRIQQPGESFDSFLTALRGLLTTCNIHADEQNNALTDRIVYGINSPKVREDIFNLDGNPDLDKVIQLCRRAEATQHYLTDMKSTTSEAVNAVQSSSHRSDTRNRSTGVFVDNCKYCAGKHVKGKCPAYGKECSKCHKLNHFSRACLSKPSKTSTTTKTADEVVEETKPECDMTFTVSSDNRKEWCITVGCKNKPLKLKVDTGASCNVMPKCVFDSLDLDVPVQKYNKSLISFSNHQLDVVGKITVLVDVSTKYVPLDFVIVASSSGQRSLLGLPSAIQLGLVNVSNTVTDDIARDYADVFTGLGCLPCKHALQVKEGAKPVIQNARRVPFRLREKLKATLKTMESEGTIMKVKQATDWVHPIVNILKPNGSLRICLDPTQLNKNLKREHFALPTATEIFAKLSKSRVFTTLDATSGFLQLELDKESSLLTTFATPFGRYRFLRLPYGISSSPEIFCRTVSEIFEDIEGVECYVDDLLIHAPTEGEHDAILHKVLERCRARNLRLNEAKCNFRQTHLKYLGHIIGEGVIEADPDKIRAIVDMPTPQNKEDIRRVLGMATYLSKFCPNLSDVTAPLRELTKTGVDWSWSKSHVDAWAKLKSLVAANPTLKMFDPELPIVLSVDASQFGMGAVIMHDGHPIEYASCALTETQKRYAQIEKEFLAVQFGLQRFHQYIYGQHIVVETDHLPLIGIMKKGLNDISARLLRMRLRNQLYDYTLVHKPGKTLILADTLSRAFLSETCDNAHEFEQLDFDQVHAVTTGILTNPTFKEKLVTAVQSDPSMQILMSYIQNGWPDRRNMCVEPLKPYWAVKDDLTTHEGLVLRNNQIVIPVSMRKQVLDIIHAGHLGVSKCVERAKSAVYWPGYHSQINDLVVGCVTCQENMRANAQCSFEPYDIPEYPMQSVSMDIFHLDGQEYLVTVDRYSKWPACYELKSSRSSEIVEVLSRQFLDFGKPEVLVSDNASYFTSYEFQCFVQELEIHHVTSSPYYSQSNGLAERMNQTIKSSLKKAKESGQTLFDVLTSLRSTPLGSKLPSPAVLLQCRNLRDSLHIMPQQLKTQSLDLKFIEETFRRRQSEAMLHTSPGKQPTEYCVGMKVWCRLGHRKWTEGTIVEHAEAPRSFYVDIGHGKILRKNQKYLRLHRVPSLHSYPHCPNLPSTPVVSMTGSSSVESSQSNSAHSNECDTEHSQSSPIPELEQPSLADPQPVVSSKVQYTRAGRMSKPPDRYGQ